MVCKLCVLCELCEFQGIRFSETGHTDHPCLPVTKNVFTVALA